MISDTDLSKLDTRKEKIESAVMFSLLVFVAFCYICTFPITIGNMIVALSFERFVNHTLDISPIISAVSGVIVYSVMTIIGLFMFR